MATDFNDLVRKTRPQRMRRADQMIVPREMELERRFALRQSDAWWQHDDVRQFASSFALFFCGAMIFLA